MSALLTPVAVEHYCDMLSEASIDRPVRLAITRALRAHDAALRADCGAWRLISRLSWLPKHNKEVPVRLYSRFRDKEFWAITWLILVMVGLIGVFEYKIWTTFETIECIMFHVVPLGFVLTLWAVSVLGEKEISHDDDYV